MLHYKKDFLFFVINITKNIHKKKVAWKIKLDPYEKFYLEKNRFNNLTESKIDHLNLIIELTIITPTTRNK